MADIECPRCGHQALAVATRCPRCGEAFPAELLQHPAPERRWIRPVLAVGAVVAAIAVVGLMAGDGGGAEEGTAALATVPESRSAAADSGPITAPLPAAVPPPPPPPPSPLAPPRPAAGASLGAAPRRATTWVNVREARSPLAPIVRVLQPGDVVLADSMSRGWYRVVAEGHTLGYADRRFLAPATADVPPP